MVDLVLFEPYYVVLLEVLPLLQQHAELKLEVRLALLALQLEVHDLQLELAEGRQMVVL